MRNTRLDLPKNSTSLVFEPVGWDIDELDGMSCRMRTRFETQIGDVFYLEIHGKRKGPYDIQSVKSAPFDQIGHIMHARQVFPSMSYHDSRLRLIEGAMFEYTYQGILTMVNTRFGTDFTSIDVRPDVNVHETDKPLCSLKAA